MVNTMAKPMMNDVDRRIDFQSPAGYRYSPAPPTKDMRRGLPNQVYSFIKKKERTISGQDIGCYLHASREYAVQYVCVEMKYTTVLVMGSNPTWGHM